MKNDCDIVAYTDGGARGNPGPAAVGVVIQDSAGHTIRRFGAPMGIATNNEAEYAAVILALKKIKAILGGKKAKDARLEIRMDSELIVRQLRGEYKIKEERLFPYFIRAWNLRMDFGAVSYRHIPRAQNSAADEEVNAALDRGEQKLFSD